MAAARFASRPICGLEAAAVAATAVDAAEMETVVLADGPPLDKGWRGSETGVGGTETATPPPPPPSPPLLSSPGRPASVKWKSSRRLSVGIPDSPSMSAGFGSGLG